MKLFSNKMTKRMIFDDEDFLMLQEADFPDFFIDKHHPDDFIPNVSPMNIEKIFHRLSGHNKLILRISIQINNIFIPFTFILDTGAPSYIYINSITRRLIKNRILDDELGNQFIYISGKKLSINPSPTNHSDVNIIGLLGLSHFGLILDKDDFDFLRLPNYF